MVGCHRLEEYARCLGAFGGVEFGHLVLAHHSLHAVHGSCVRLGVGSHSRSHVAHVVAFGAVFGPHGLIPCLEPTGHGLDLGSLGVLDLRREVRDLGADAVLGEHHVAHLHGLLVVRNHHLREHDVRVVVLLRHSIRTGACRRVRGRGIFSGCTRGRGCSFSAGGVSGRITGGAAGVGAAGGECEGRCETQGGDGQVTLHISQILQSSGGCAVSRFRPDEVRGGQQVPAVPSIHMDMSRACGACEKTGPATGCGGCGPRILGATDAEVSQ